MVFLYFLYRGLDLWYLDLQLHMQSVPVVTTEVVNSNPAHAGVLDTTLCDKVCQ